MQDLIQAKQGGSMADNVHDTFMFKPPRHTRSSKPGCEQTESFSNSFETSPGQKDRTSSSREDQVDNGEAVGQPTARADMDSKFLTQN